MTIRALPPFKRLISVCLISLGVSGCMHLSDISYANREVPSYFTARDFITDQQMAPLGGDIQWFAGRLGYKRSDGKFVFTKRLIVGSPEIKVTTFQKSPEYHSVLTAGFAGGGTLPMLKADASGNTASDYEITDVANVVLPDSSMPTRANAAAQVPEIPAGTALWWVNAVGLSIVRYSVATNTKGGTSLSGAAFQANGTVYDNLTVGSYVPLAAVLVQPMNAAADVELAAAPNPVPSSKPQPPKALTDKLAAMTASVATAVGDGAHVGPDKVQKAPPDVQWRPVLTKGNGLLIWTTEDK